MSGKKENRIAKEWLGAGGIHCSGWNHCHPEQNQNSGSKKGGRRRFMDKQIQALP